MEENRSSLQLKKHVGAIHSSHETGLLQRKINNVLLYNAYPELLAKESYFISIKELSQLIGFKSNDTRKVKDALIGLQQTNVQWNVLNPETGKMQWGTAGLIGEAIIEGGVCFYSYTPTMRKLLHEPEMYGCIDINVQSKFKSSYGLALYENCVRYKNIPQTPWLKMVTLRLLLGVPDGKYSVFRDFKRRVIEKAVSEVNKHSTLDISYEIKYHYSKRDKDKRAEKKIEAVRFLIKKNNQLPNSEEKLCIDKEFGFSAKEAKELVKTYGAEKIKEKISYVKSLSTYKEGTIRNLRSYFLSSLEENYQRIKPQTSTPIKLKKLDDIQAERQTAEVAKQEADREALSAYKLLNEDEKYKVLLDFEVFIKEHSYVTYVTYMRNKVLTNPIVLDFFSIFFHKSLFFRNRVKV